MQLKTEFDAQAIHHALRAIGDGTKNTKAVLRRFNNYLRGQTFVHFREMPGWPPLAESTLKQKRTYGGLGVLSHSQLAIARAEAAVRSKLRSALKRAGKSKAKNALKRQKTVAKRQAMIEEFETYIALRRTDADAAAKMDSKTLQSTKERLGRAEEKKGRTLGQLRASIDSTFSEDGLEIKSRIPWAGVHNEGGAVGNGAVVPARPFLFLTPQDEQKLVEITEDYLTDLVNGDL